MNFKKLFALALFVNACTAHKNALTPALSMLTEARLKHLLQLNACGNRETEIASASTNALDLIGDSCRDIHEQISHFNLQCFESNFVRFTQHVLCISEALDDFRTQIKAVNRMIWTVCHLRKSTP